MKLSNTINEFMNAAFSGIYVHTQEPGEALQEIRALAGQNGWLLATWDINNGLTVGSAKGTEDPDPVVAINTIMGVEKSSPEQASILCLRNGHRFLDKIEVVQALEQVTLYGKQHRIFVILLAPVVDLPVELQKLFVVIDHQLPDPSEMDEILKGVATEPSDLPDSKDGVSHLLEAAAGLTRFEAEGAFSLAIARHGQVRPSTIWEIKSATLKKSGLMTLHRGGEKFDGIGGLDNLKGFCTRALTHKKKNKKEVKPKGVLLLGPPGTGKSQFAKALGNETDRPTIILNVGALMGSLVGQTEENTRRALAIVDAMAPCILFLDELEKSLAGSTSGGSNDSGVGMSLFGSLLTWLNDHETDVFFVGTSNDIRQLPSAFSRAGRMDAIFFLDLPSRGQKDRIWEIYEDVFEIEKKARRPDDTDWTGAEIKACCRLSAMLGISLMDAAQNIVPVAVTGGEEIESLRNWSAGRCLSAESNGLYTRAIEPANTTPKASRNIKRPSSN